jgi:hypothetical protein
MKRVFVTTLPNPKALIRAQIFPRRVELAPVAAAFPRPS